MLRKHLCPGTPEVVHSRWFMCSGGVRYQQIQTALCSVAVALCIFIEGLRGTSVTSSCTGGLEHRAAWNTNSYPSRQCHAQHTWSTHISRALFPRLYSVARSQWGWGRHKVGPICPGALGAPHTMHYGWEGAQGAWWSQQKPVYRGGGSEYLGPPSPGP